MIPLFHKIINKKKGNIYKKELEEKEQGNQFEGREFFNVVKKWSDLPQTCYSMEEILQGIRDDFTTLLRTNVFESGLNQNEIEKRLNQKKQLRKALRECAYGDINSKVFVKGYIKELLLSR